jgi:glycosyltransferase involved in cell wall biosynthesis
VHRLDPGFHAVQRPSGLPPEIHCLLLGRAEDATLKGLDIAARALGSVAKRNRLTAPPRLIVRGAPSGTGKDLRKSLVDFAKFHLDIEVRPYSPDVERLQRDILASSLVLMPSRSEGFGLVGLEAIAAGTPVLVSDQSGLSVLLRERLGKLAEPAIVATHSDLDQAAPEWERAVESVLLDRRAAFARAATLRQELAIGLTWAEAIRRLEAAWSPFFTDLPPAP